MFNLYIVVCWEKQSLFGVYTNEEQAIEIAKGYAHFHKCKVDVLKYIVRFGI